MTPSPLAPARFPELPVIDGVRFATAAAGVRYHGRDDVMLALLAPGSAVAGVFTRSATRAAPVLDCQNKIGLPADGGAAIVVNSGNANAFTGREGVVATEAITAAVADTLGLDPKRVFSSSTGVIGELLAYDRIVGCLPDLKQRLDPGAIKSAAAAIMTTDTFAKGACAEIEIDGKTVRIAGIAKGSGMISPDMATMLAYIFTDAAVDKNTLQTMVGQLSDVTFNCITVDGDMSTNDTVLLFANGLAGNGKLGAADLKTFQATLNHVCLALAKMIVRDGEGISRVITVRITGAKSFTDADAAARAVGNSALVKTSWSGGDPNWGRIIDALGYSPAKVVEEKVDIAYSTSGSHKKIYSLKKGRPTRTAFGMLCKAVEPIEFDLHINLNLGRATAVLHAADLTEAYVEFNKGNINDPSSLGG